MPDCDNYPTTGIQSGFPPITYNNIGGMIVTDNNNIMSTATYIIINL